MKDIRTIVKSRKIRDILRYSLRMLPSPLYLKLYYYSFNGKFPNLKHPIGYNEKLQWLKLHDKHPEYSILVDKYRVREVIKEKLGDGYMFPLLGHWNSFDDIDFSTLPNEFVLKCNHDSGSVRIIKDKSALSEQDWRELRNFYTSSLKHNFYYAGREYPYKDVKPCIIAEQLMHDKNGDPGGIKDYKFFCFDGKPVLMLYVSGRQTEKHEDYFDMDYNWHPEILNGWTPSKVCPPKPTNFDEMKHLCEILSQGMRHVRMDFYDIDGKLYFGEFTFFSGGGFELFHPDEVERKLGDLIKID